MSGIRLEGFTPPAQTAPDADAPTQVRIERAIAPEGPWSVARLAFVLSPAITDPAHPPTYDFTVDDPLGAGDWWRVVWIEPDTTEWPTDPQPFRPLSPFAPSVGEVASMLRARLVELGGGRVVNFTDRTEPRASDVAGLIAQITPLVLLATGDLSTLTCPRTSDLLDAVRTIIAQRVAIEVELSYRPEEIGESAAAAAAERRTSIDADLDRLVSAIERCRASGVEDPDSGSTGRSDAAWQFPIVPFLNW